MSLTLLDTRTAPLEAAVDDADNGLETSRARRCIAPGHDVGVQ
jgi:hypothetical protein